jgi:hypothetical protein
MKTIITLMAKALIVLTLVGCAATTAGSPTGSPSATTEVSAAVTPTASPSAATAEATPAAATAEATPAAATAEATPAAATDPNGGTPITIIIGDTRIEATLNDSAVAKEFAAMLPITLPWFRNAGIEYITELSAPLTETGPFYTDVRAGDIVYYNPLDSITIIYAPTSSVPTLTKMGVITSDLSVFRDLPDNVDMRIELR